MSKTQSGGDNLLDEFAHLSATWRRTLHSKLLRWYERHRRELPWRRRPTTYRVWVSEIMLQQTQVATVVPYYRRFLNAFPTVQRLAAAPERDVLRLWEGLGYYRRARQMHAAARQIVARFGSRCPRTVAEWRSLPGVGRYTAGAIASIACGQPAPILEANTQRLYCRLLGWEGDPRSAYSQQLLWSLAEWVQSPTRPGDLNQALMELGSQICTPREPNCPRCPLRSLCEAARRGAQDRIPTASARPATVQVREAAVAVERHGKWLLRQGQSHERWSGLWDFLRFDHAVGPLALEKLVERIHLATGLQVELDGQPRMLRHQVTRFRIDLTCYRARTIAGALQRRGQVLRWFALKELEHLPLNVTGRKFARTLEADGIL